jgi:hypothetical protein
VAGIIHVGRRGEVTRCKLVPSPREVELAEWLYKDSLSKTLAAFSRCGSTHLT